MAEEPPPYDVARAARFEALCRLLHGPDDWRARSAAALGVSLRNLQYWTAAPPAAFKAIPAGVLADLERDLRQRAGDPDELAALEARVDALQRRWLAAVDALVSVAGEAAEGPEGSERDN